MKNSASVSKASTLKTASYVILVPFYCCSNLGFWKVSIETESDGAVSLELKMKVKWAYETGWVWHTAETVLLRINENIRRWEIPTHTR